MCGRIYQTLPLNRLISIARSRMALNPEAYNSSFNVCPTTYIPAIRSNKRFVAQSVPEPQNIESQKKEQQKVEEVEQGVQEVENKESEEYELGFSKWGLNTKHNLVINARSEEMFLKPTFTKIIQNRCVIIMEGYFEWNSKKQGFSFKSKTSDHMLVAGLYNEDNEVVILTRDAGPGFKDVHHRMPVILSADQIKQWLNPQNNSIISKVVQHSFLSKQKSIWSTIQTTKLAPYVNSIKQKSSKCLMSFEDYQKQLDKNGIMKFFKKKTPVVQTVGKDGQILTLTQTKKKVDEEIGSNEKMKLDEKQQEEVPATVKKYD